MLIREINDRFAINGALRFEHGQQGLLAGVVETPACAGSFYLHGAHVTSFRPHGRGDVLFVSEQAEFTEGRAIRGGVPICFPWFSTHATDRNAPAHGTARIKSWELVSAETIGNRVMVTLATEIEPYRLKYKLDYGDSLAMTLSVTNRAAKIQRFESALHTYFAIENIRSIEIQGLQDLPFLDQLSDQMIGPSGEAICFTQETDRIYQGSASPTVIVDHDAQRQIIVDSSGSRSTVVWNPWIAKAERMADFGNDEWQRMCCVETANIRPHDVEIGPGQTHEMTAIVRTESPT